MAGFFRLIPATIGLVGLMVLAGCEASVATPSGFFEPIVVHDAELQTAPMQSAATDTAPKVLALETTSQVLLHGQEKRTLSGRVSEPAFAVAVRVLDQGSNWWVLPVGSVDPDFADQRAFALEFDVGTTLPAGSHKLALAAIDEEGRLGEQTTLSICVLDDSQPANFSICDATQKPPELAVNLVWNTDVDLDLVVVTPAGDTLAWKTPGSTDKDGTKPKGRLLRDSNPHCVLDRRNSESVVFDKEAPSGTYLIYANFFAACGESGVLFAAQVEQGIANADGTYRQIEIFRTYGAFIAQQASNFSKAPLYLGKIDVP